ncbi:serine hydrolase domain-containing protein [Nonomuraea sp. NPDC049028]|uniref:serine hydrolase domain-containing protein n=1 Tax=Nonomuraea sp. NPDC049028 TaxID=3364348 RepID=UPI0037212635
MKSTTAARTAGLACVMLALSIAAPATAADRPQTRNVQEALNALAKTTGVVGAIGEVYVDGKRVGQGSAGSRLLDGKGGKIPAGSRYRVGSQTKQMTATVLLQLVREGKLGLDDKLSDVLPQVAQQDLVERADEITVRQLIRHTSGIPDFFASELFDDFDFTTYHPPIELVKATRGLPRTGAPGEKFSYSNTNYMLLGMIIEKVTGHPLSAELARRVFAPVGMSRTYLPTKPPAAIKGPHGHGYYPGPDGKLRDMDRLNASYGYAAGGVISTARDVSAFQRAFVQGKLLPASLQRVITDPPEDAPPQPSPGARLCGSEPALQAIGGSGSGFVATTFTSPDGRLQLAVSATLSVSNRDFSPAAIDQVAKAVFCPGK